MTCWMVALYTVNTAEMNCNENISKERKHESTIYSSYHFTSQVCIWYPDSVCSFFYSLVNALSHKSVAAMVWPLLWTGWPPLTWHHLVPNIKKHNIWSEKNINVMVRSYLQWDESFSRIKEHSWKNCVGLEECIGLAPKRCWCHCQPHIEGHTLGLVLWLYKINVCSIDQPTNCFIINAHTFIH